MMVYYSLPLMMASEKPSACRCSESCYDMLLEQESSTKAHTHTDLLTSSSIAYEIGRLYFAGVCRLPLPTPA
jgi:predicted adenine nucleotide alpha hydrolase (AANH) superfamily ATPase